ncbi:MAG: flavodoxin family protein [Bacteroidota bacterium]
MQEYTTEEFQALKQHLTTISRADLEAYIIEYLPREEIMSMNLAAPLLKEHEARELRKQLRLKEEDLSLRSVYDEDFMNQAFEKLRPYAVNNPQLLIHIANDIIQQLDQALQRGNLFDVYEQEVGFNLSEETEFLVTVCLTQKEPQSTAFLIELLEFYRQLKFADDMAFSFPEALMNRVMPYRDHSMGTLQQILQARVFELLPLRIQQMIVENNYKRIPREQQLNLFAQFYKSNIHIAILLAELQIEADQIKDAKQTLDYYRKEHITKPNELPKRSEDPRLSQKWYPLRYHICEAEADTDTAWAVISAFIYHFNIEGIQLNNSHGS